LLLPFKSNKTYKARSQIIADIFTNARSQSHVLVADRPQASHPRDAAGIVSKGQVDEQVKEFVLRVHTDGVSKNKQFNFV
jgi:hypothetical protein